MAWRSRQYMIYIDVLDLSYGKSLDETLAAFSKYILRDQSFTLQEQKDWTKKRGYETMLGGVSEIDVVDCLVKQLKGGFSSVAIIAYSPLGDMSCMLNGDSSGIHCKINGTDTSTSNVEDAITWIWIKGIGPFFDRYTAEVNRRYSLVMILERLSRDPSSLFSKIPRDVLNWCIAPRICF